MKFQDSLGRQRDVLSTLKGAMTLIRDSEKTDSVYDEDWEKLLAEWRSQLDIELN